MADPDQDALVRTMAIRFSEYVADWAAERKPWQLKRAEDFAAVAFRRYAELVTVPYRDGE